MKNGLFVKICGITRAVDAKLAVDLGADAVGFISYRKSPRTIHPERVSEILAALPENYDFKKVGVFVNAELEEIESYLQAGLDTLQLHGDESADFARNCAELKTREGNPPEIWKAFSPTTRSEIEACQMFPADKFLLDAFKKGMRGGTGKVMDLNLAEFAVSTLPKPVILAGGVSPANLAEIVERVHPYGVDANSGVETSPGVKDEKKVERLLEIAGTLSFEDVHH